MRHHFLTRYLIQIVLRPAHILRLLLLFRSWLTDLRHYTQSRVPHAFSRSFLFITVLLVMKSDLMGHKITLTVNLLS